jgi:hypothetical protein
VKVYISAQSRRKEFGRNVSMENPAFRTALDKYLALLESDIAAGNVEELPGGEPE